MPSPLSVPMLKLIDVDFDYQEQALLSGVSFSLVKGNLLHLRGANGSGKTTLIKLIAGLYQAHQGQILFNDQSIASNLPVYQRQLCYVSHKPGINPYLSVRENCLFDTHYPIKQLNIANLAEMFQLEGHLDKLCGLLSAGQRRQVSLLRLWMSDAKLWLLDEPLVALDEQAIAVLMEQIAVHRQQGGSVILTSHQSLPLKPSQYQEYCL